MHIEDWHEEFLSKFSPEEYYACLKKAKLQSAMENPCLRYFIGLPNFAEEETYYHFMKGWIC
jgi:hypothetical protein